MAGLRDRIPGLDRASITDLIDHGPGDRFSDSGVRVSVAGGTTSLLSELNGTTLSGLATISGVGCLKLSRAGLYVAASNTFQKAALYSPLMSSATTQSLVIDPALTAISAFAHQSLVLGASHTIGSASSVTVLGVGLSVSNGAHAGGVIGVGGAIAASGAWTIGSGINSISNSLRLGFSDFYATTLSDVAGARIGQITGLVTSNSNYSYLVMRMA